MFDRYSKRVESAEARILKAAELKTTNKDFLADIHRHMDGNMKVGTGYNFGKLSDEIIDLTYYDGRVFLKVVGKF